MTNGVFVHGVESNATTTAARIEGGLMQADTNPNAAAKGMGTEIDLTLDGMRQTFGNMNVEDMSTQSAHRVRLTIF
jgi:predicted NUDIX family NTP pyrophosphohydrolase